MAKMFGYARANDAQVLECEREFLIGFRSGEDGCVSVFTDLGGGIDRNLPQRAALLSLVKADDIIVITGIDRLARGHETLAAIWRRLQRKGAKIAIADESGMTIIDNPWGITSAAIGALPAVVEDRQRGND